MSVGTEVHIRELDVAWLCSAKSALFIGLYRSAEGRCGDDGISPYGTDEGGDVLIVSIIADGRGRKKLFRYLARLRIKNTFRVKR